MLTPDLLHDYQKRAVNFQCSMPETAIWLDPGLGKTVTTLTSAAHLINTGLVRNSEEALLTAADVAMMCALLKIARLQNMPDHEDSWIDLAGYAACGSEVTSRNDLTNAATGVKLEDDTKGKNGKEIGRAHV